MKLSTVAVNDVHVSFGDEMKQARQRLGMTQAELAEAVGASLSAVSNWERGINTRITAEARIRDVLKLNGHTPAGLQDVSDAMLVASIGERVTELTRRLFELRSLTTESTADTLPDGLVEDPLVGGRRSQDTTRATPDRDRSP